VNYDEIYERAVYDRYHAAVNAYMQQHRLWYVDLWNAFPPERFLNTSLHLDVQGTTMEADMLIEELKRAYSPAFSQAR
jgi:hypothetical protein